MTERRFTEEETQVVLRKAAELAAERRTDTGGHYTLDELKSIASEAGISAQDIEAAIQSVPHDVNSKSGVLGPSALPHFEIWLDGEVDKEMFPELIHVIRRGMARQGVLTEHSNGFDWSARSGTGGRYVTVMVSKGKTLIRCSGNYRDGAAASYVLGSTGAITLGAAAFQGLGLFATLGLATVPALAVPAFFAGRFVWTRAGASENRRLENVFKELEQLISGHL